jgi:down-regulator of transcription 1
MIAAEANELCENERKKTIMGEHVLHALEKLGFEDYVPEVYEVLNEYQNYIKVGYPDREVGNM